VAAKAAATVVAVASVEASALEAALAVEASASVEVAMSTVAATIAVVTVASRSPQDLSAEEGPRMRALLLRVPTVAVVCFALASGLAGGAIAWRNHGNESLYSYEQSGGVTEASATVLSAAHVEALVAQAPEPVPVGKRTRPAAVHCRPGAPGILRNPWSCTIRYRSGTRARYRVTVQPDGSYNGVGTGIITGCCVKTPTLD
jgi:hypothetical protein